jgi:heme-degrading monooxygenase HmoA
MVARVSRYTGDADGMREGFESVSPELEQLDGFVQAFFLTDGEHGRGISITLWDSRGALDASAERAHQMRTAATQPSNATIESVESYDVVLTVGAPSRSG